MEKKGISPLIATVLLIGFTIVLAAVVMRWGSEFVRETTEETACLSDLSIVCTNLRVEITNAFSNSTGIYITISSASDQTIDGFRIIGWSGTVTGFSEERSTVLEPYSTREYSFVNTSAITRIEALPLITPEGCEIGTCVESGVEYTL